MKKKRFVAKDGKLIDRYNPGATYLLSSFQGKTKSEIAQSIYHNSIQKSRNFFLQQNHQKLLKSAGVIFGIVKGKRMLSISSDRIIDKDLREHFERVVDAVNNNPYRKKQQAMKGDNKKQSIGR